MLELFGLSRLGIVPFDLMIGDGECVSIMGRSGSGKSVVLRMIADLDPHDGEAFLDGVSCASMPASAWRGKVTYVAAESGWWAERVTDHFPAGACDPDLLQAVGVPVAARDWPVARLSTGERQRLALLRAMRPSNRVLLLDEPTSGLDARSVAQVETLLRSRLAVGGAVVMVTHDAEQAARMANRRFHLRDGILLEDAP